MTTAYILVNGTGADFRSQYETVRNLSLALQSQGHQVYQFGGPGSTTQTISRSLYDKAESGSIHDIDFPADYLLGYPVNFATGIAAGAGAWQIAEQVRDTVLKAIKSGATEVTLIGFSRGAVIIAMALAELKSGKANLRGVPLNAFLLDPVPGPWSLPKEVTIPSFVKTFGLYVSKDESRSGFDPLSVALESTGTRLFAEMISGVHGDIGGSTRSLLSQLVFDDLVGAAALGLPRQSPRQRSELFLGAIEKGEDTKNVRLLSGQNFSRRYGQFNWPTYPGLNPSNCIDFMYDRVFQEMMLRHQMMRAIVNGQGNFPKHQRDFTPFDWGLIKIIERKSGGNSKNMVKLSLPSTTYVRGNKIGFSQPLSKSIVPEVVDRALFWAKRLPK